jgi:signal transduction histidine kinase/CheY-like chemotaxis protein
MEVVLRAQANLGEFGSVNLEEEVRRRMALMRSTRGTVVIERVRPNGTALELRRSRLPGGGLVTLYIDVSARKRAEEALAAAVRLAEEAADQKSRFVAIVSHEIRTPLNAVINCLGLLDESDLAPSQRRLADTAREAGEALMELVNDILELSNAEAGKLELRPSVFELPPLLEGVRSMFQGNAGKRGVKLVLEVASTLPRQIRADSGRLRQVMMNLVSNAGKFSSPGAVTIRAGMVEEDQRPMLRLAVEDQGPAIPASEAAKLFVPFSRLRNARTSGAPGTGLGLAICDRLAKLMGGRVELQVAATGGNEFALLIPLEAADMKQSLLPIAQSEVSLVQRPRARILIVEDIPANHLVAATLLRREGFKVDVAEAGAIAIAMVQRMPYDLVLMDLIMPEMDGLEATRRIRALQGQPTRLPVIALTATTSADDRVRCIAAGMDDMLGKPIRPSALFGTVGRSLSHMARTAQDAVEIPLPLSDYETAPILDEVRLAELAQGLAPATVASLVDQCLDDMRQRMPHLRAVLGGTDARAIEIAAHALSGMSASYGFASLESRMRAIIRYARAGDFAEAAKAGVGMEGDLAVAAEAVHLHLRAIVA